MHSRTCSTFAKARKCSDKTSGLEMQGGGGANSIVSDARRGRRTAQAWRKVRTFPVPNAMSISGRTKAGQRHRLLDRNRSA